MVSFSQSTFKKEMETLIQKKNFFKVLAVNSIAAEVEVYDPLVLKVMFS